ncbi:carbamoyl-phosphate synthase L chain, ATP binding domain-containing protein [Hyaloraphidium curvatum]|nr:carbamoyl-phosphate synthase L chain, ATP binding domain-containing protein [Hyaloraphidium curvatum]
MENPQSFKNGDLKISYSVFGPEDGPPVVFLHGISGSRYTWGPVIDRFSDKYRCYAVDARGHGASDRAPGMYTTKTYASDPIALLDTVIKKPAVIVGHSLGGVEAFLVAVARPELVKAVVLEDPPLYMLSKEVFDATPYSAAFVFLKGDIGAAQAAGKSPEGYAAEAAKRPIAPGSTVTAGDVFTPYALNAAAKARLLMDLTMWDAVLEGTALDHDEDAPTQVPGRLIRADMGAAFFPGHAERFAKHAPNISVHETPGALHQIHDSKAFFEGFVGHVAAVLAEAFYADSDAGAARPRNPLLPKVLVANRGEIAVRVIATLKRLGIASVAVYSDADRQGMWVAMADEAYALGGQAASESYLKGDRIVEIALACGAKGIHPGYGFLSENADFADLVESKGLAFIGPRGHSIRDMGSKSESKRLMLAAGVPCVPGYHGEDQSPALLAAEAERIGFPVLIKAVKGGGGKGMRIATSAAEFPEQLESARREAERSFGDGRVLVEKYITRPRHVEVQVFADGEDGYVHLYERDCSVQRRHQKIIEEAPAPHLPQDLRARLHSSAIAAARAVKYRGAGTVEFILDAATLDTPEPLYYFMEMNTRLQVEHPVTEMVAGVDLVEWQVEVASGNGLPASWLATNSDRATAGPRAPNGWAFETRLYAENPANNFFPAPGPLLHLRFPPATPTLRIETGVREGDEVGVLYDPMVAKLVAWGRDRGEALRRMREALARTEIVGPGTNVEFLKRLCTDARFAEGDVDTGFIAARKAELLPVEEGTPSREAAAAGAAALLASAGGLPAPGEPDPWAAFRGFAVNGPGGWKGEVGWEVPDAKAEGGRRQVRGEVEVVFARDGSYGIALSEKPAKGEPKVVLRLEGVRVLRAEVGSRAARAGKDTCAVSLRLDLPPHGASPRSLVECNAVVVRDARAERDGSVNLFLPSGLEVLQLPLPPYARQAHKMEAAGSVITPMPCRIISVLVEPGAVVEKGQPLVVLEAMKMEHVIKAPDAGKIAKVMYKVGDTVGEGKVLVQMEGQEEDEAKKADDE